MLLGAIKFDGFKGAGYHFLKMAVGILTIEIFIPASLSLKEKKRTLNSLKERLRRTFNISIAEIGLHGKWQRSILAVANVNVNKKQAESQLNKIIDFIDKFGKVQLLDCQTELL